MHSIGQTININIIVERIETFSRSNAGCSALVDIAHAALVTLVAGETP